MAKERMATENLSNEKKDIVSQLSRETFFVFYGTYPSERVPEIYWNTDIGGDWREFLKVAKATGTTVLYIDWVDFTREYFEEALPRTGSVNSVNEDDEERKQELEHFTKYLGTTAAIRLGFFMNGTFHVYEDETLWHEEFGALLGQDDSSEGPQDEDEEEDARELTEDWAEKLSNESEFAGLKKRSDKRSLLRKLAGNEFKKLHVDNVLWRADTLHAKNLRAINDERLAKQVKELRAKNMSNLAIAGKLGIPARQVTILLARFED
jgi:hypothetical protein